MLVADALEYEVGFFYDPTPRATAPISFHRKRQKLGARDKDAIDAQAEVYRRTLKKLLAAVDIESRLPPPASIDLDEYDGNVEVAAALARRRWSVPRGPIGNLTRLVEDSGIIIVPFDFGTPLVDGFYHHAQDSLPPIIFINNRLKQDRYRFSLAHALGHIVLHHSPNREMEIEANRFASEFLMPTEEIECQFYNLSLRKFMDLKLYWRTSMQSLIYKGWQVGKMSDRGYKYYMVEMSRRGFRTSEPIELPGPIEAPSTFRQLLAAHIGELGYSIQELSSMLGLREAEFRESYPLPSERPRLRLVV
jgi:Zn-dependent peptidase ImmA (M78 family)